MEAKMQLNTLMDNMFATGLLDDQFRQLHMLHEGSSPDFIIEIITLFCKEGEWIINDLAKLLNKPFVDFNKVNTLLYRLQGSSATVGAQRVKDTCIQFHKFCEDNTRYGCLDTLDVVRNDFYDLRSKFQIMVQLEQQVWTFYRKH
ncbi:histidine-containing phosphotransfer protein 1-like [Lolium perenne]|uniref:histidine-containing phosphotransfer protein 1-like n=1 Tax=Lolium perenne TaxID=4522 RepID=UPI003A99FAD1